MLFCILDLALFAFWLEFVTLVSLREILIELNLLFVNLWVLHKLCKICRAFAKQFTHTTHASVCLFALRENLHANLLNGRI